MNFSTWKKIKKSANSILNKCQNNAVKLLNYSFLITCQIAEEKNDELEAIITSYYDLKLYKI